LLSNGRVPRSYDLVKERQSQTYRKVAPHRLEIQIEQKKHIFCAFPNSKACSFERNAGKPTKYSKNANGGPAGKERSKVPILRPENAVRFPKWARMGEKFSGPEKCARQRNSMESAHHTASRELLVEKWNF
jgi:hypothetical protein